MLDLSSIFHYNKLGCLIDDERFKTLCEQLKSMKKLKELNIRENIITSTGMKYLKDIRNITNLKIGENNIRDEGCEILCKSNYASNLITLNLHCIIILLLVTGLLDTGMKLLCDNINKLKKLEYLDVGCIIK